MDTELSLKLYSPLSGDWLADDGGYGWSEPAEYDDPKPLDGQALLPFQEEIEAAMANDASHTAQGIDLFPYCDGDVCDKVTSIAVSVCPRNGQLMACTTVGLREMLSEDDMPGLLDYISGQFSDGWGEGFEQREIRAEGGTLYVHFWQFDDFALQTEYAAPDRGPVPAAPQRPVLPHIDLAGPDGNIYAVLGKAEQVLRQAGQTRQASDMERRVFASGSYGEALGIIGEYVQTDLPQALTRQPPRRGERGDAR